MTDPARVPPAVRSDTPDDGCDRVAPGRALSLHLEVRFEDGFLALSTFDGEPIACTLGDGTLATGLESALIGLAPGTETHVLGRGSELFSPYDDANLHWMARDDFPPEIEPVPGLVVAFDTPGGYETAGVVRAVDGDRIRVDFNHPFSARTLRIRVRILAVGVAAQPTGAET